MNGKDFDWTSKLWTRETPVGATRDERRGKVVEKLRPVWAGDPERTARMESHADSGRRANVHRGHGSIQIGCVLRSVELSPSALHGSTTMITKAGRSDAKKFTRVAEDRRHRVPASA